MTVGTCILLLLLTVGCLVYAAPIHTALAEGVFLCLQVILPSLYAMMIAAQLLIRTNAHMLLLKPLHRFTQNVLRIPDVCLAIESFGIFFTKNRYDNIEPASSSPTLFYRKEGFF